MPLLQLKTLRLSDITQARFEPRSTNSEHDPLSTEALSLWVLYLIFGGNDQTGQFLFFGWRVLSVFTYVVCQTQKDA